MKPVKSYPIRVKFRNVGAQRQSWDQVVDRANDRTINAALVGRGVFKRGELLFMLWNHEAREGKLLSLDLKTELGTFIFQFADPEQKGAPSSIPLAEKCQNHTLDIFVSADDREALDWLDEMEITGRFPPQDGDRMGAIGTETTTHWIVALQLHESGTLSHALTAYPKVLFSSDSIEDLLRKGIVPRELALN